MQAVVLRKGAQEQLGDAAALDDNLVAFTHPDGLQALLSDQISGHLTSPPFQFQEQDEGARPILKSFDLFGPHNFNSVFVRQATTTTTRRQCKRSTATSRRQRSS